MSVRLVLYDGQERARTTDPVTFKKTTKWVIRVHVLTGQICHAVRWVTNTSVEPVRVV